jgi:hypothetical protein
VKREKGPFVAGLIDAMVRVFTDDITIDDLVFYPYRQIASKEQMKKPEDFVPLNKWLKENTIMKKFSDEYLDILTQIIMNFMSGEAVMKSSTSQRCTDIWVNKKSVMFGYPTAGAGHPVNDLKGAP